MIWFLLLLFFPEIGCCEYPWSKEKPPYAISLEVSAQNISLNENLNFTLNLEYPSQLTFDKNSFQQSLLKSALPVMPLQPKSSKVEILNAGDKKNERWTFVLEPILEGKKNITPQINFLEGDKIVSTFTAEPLTVNIVDQKSDPAFKLMPAPLFSLSEPNAIQISAQNRQKYELQDRSEKLYQGFRQHGVPWGWLLLSLLALILLPVAIILLKNRAPPTREDLIREAKRKTKTLLAKFRKRLPKEQELTPSFINDLSMVMRNYIQDRFGITAPHQTTEEFLSQASSNIVLGPENQAKLKQFLFQADLVKFGNKVLSSKEASDSLDSAKSFVDQS